jgi:hypothetical protein
MRSSEAAPAGRSLTTSSNRNCTSFGFTLICPESGVTAMICGGE